MRRALQVSYRALVRPLWRPLIGLASADYVVRSGVSGELFGVPYDVGVFAPASASKIVPGNGRILTNRDGYTQDAFRGRPALSGRLGRRVDWRAWGS